MNEIEFKTLKELRADLFYQIESKFGAKKASKYPSIIKADEVIKNYDLLHSVSNNEVAVCPHCGGKLINTKEYGWFCLDIECRMKRQTDC